MIYFMMLGQRGGRFSWRGWSLRTGRGETGEAAAQTSDVCSMNRLWLRWDRKGQARGTGESKTQDPPGLGERRNRTEQDGSRVESEEGERFRCPGANLRRSLGVYAS